ncbi:MAG TPA: hypothetical protein VN624_00330 [Rhodanobacter sp.]|nr:hypothetical protein [Rhodanobacter sp.]
MRMHDAHVFRSLSRAVREKTMQWFRARNLLPDEEHAAGIGIPGVSDTKSGGHGDVPQE